MDECALDTVGLSPLQAPPTAILAVDLLVDGVVAALRTCSLTLPG